MSLSGMAGSALGGIFACDCSAQAVELVVSGVDYLADFQGNLKVLLDPNKLTQFLSGAISLVPLLIQEHVSNGVGAIIGPITVVKDPNREPPQSTLTSPTPGQPFPAIQEMVVNIHVTIPNLLPGITLQNKIPTNPGPPILRNGNVTGFPPKGDLYNLSEPIDLEDVNNPGPVLATIKTFPVKVGI
ncbi:MAG: hypothetical protein JO125_00995 [Chloroflexi bacterium]|nr:hypothetical protein [Ktedonobacteraceae bacterium]MBV9019920.1 hypothetical protein [Ktedonobacteraceae bacterium]MBV9705966.1 hypothetical protein [Chloroflexota bacterium]